MPNCSESKAEVNAKDNLGETPLHRAELKHHKDVVRLLLEYAADVNAKDNLGHTPLCRAQLKNHKEIVDLLRQQGGHE